MNDAHLHLIVNHFPIIGTIFGFGILLLGLILGNTTLKNTAYSIFILAALFGLASMATGDGAEEMVADMPDIGKQIIHEHEEIAEKLALLLDVLGVVSILGLFLNYKKHAKAKLVSYLALVIASVAVFVAQQVGTSGGEIRHSEIRPNATAAPAPAGTESTTSEDKD